ncbi:MAG: TolC family outer membrane protein [Pararhodobacter sp.]
MGVLARIRTAACGMVLVAAVALPAGADTLADALVGAYRNSNLLEQNRALLRAADEDVQQAIAALGPVVDFVMQAYSSSENAPSALLSAGLSASVTLFDFGRGDLAVDAARQTVLATRAALIGLEQNVLLGAAAAYLNLYSQVQALQLQRNNVSVINEQLRAARERFELGDSTRTDVAIAEARLAAARSALAAAEGQVAVAREEYNLAVGHYPNGLTQPPALPRLPASLEAAQDIARRNHPSIQQAQYQVAAADLGAEIAGRQRYGSLTASIGIEGSIRHINPLPSSETLEVTGALRWGVPIYNGGRLNSVERQGVARAEAQRAALHQTVALVHQSVASTWAQLQVARSRLEASNLQINAAQSAYDAVRAEADLGSRTTLDVLNAEQELLDARSARISAYATVQTAAYALLEAMGQLTVEGLNLGIPTYDVEAYTSAFRPAPPRETPSEQSIRLERILGRYGPRTD